ncbi:MAG: hypothetical protein QMD36_01425 [Candidatus Aenigmarchaeota archaeon]|nr:hypothetical protein [Candidatus Aenigmarchaeota archaeon]
MTMVLEYPMNILILTVVVLVIIGIMFHFREQIMNICLFPPCEEEIRCNIKPAVVTESVVDINVIEKYCKMCWGKNRNGECGEDALCYVVNIPSSNPSSIALSPEVSRYCSITCSRDVTSFFVQYNFLDKKIYVAC